MVEALSGGRWQGSSSAESSTVTTEQDLFNSSFTTSGNASQTTATDTTGKVVMTQSGGSGNNAKAYRTLSNSYNAKTFTIDFTFTRNSGDNANNSGVSFGSDNTADGNISGNAKRLMFAFENGSYIRVKVETVATNNTFTDTTSFQATGTTKYYRFVGNGSNVVLTMFPTLSDRTNGTNADRTYQSVDFPSDWLTTDSIDTFTLEGWSGYHAGNWEVSDVQISMNNYADEKDSLTNVPANTRYEETDTRKIYRRVIGNTTTNVSMATSDWTSTRTSSDGNPYIDSDGSELDYTIYNNSSTIASTIHDLGSALSDTKWVARIHINNTTTNNDGAIFIQFTDTAGNISTTSNADRIFCMFYKNSGQGLNIMGTANGQKNFWTDGGGVSSLYTGGDTGVTTGDCYIEITRQSTTTGVIKVGTNSDYTSNTSYTISNLPSTVTGLRYIQIGNSNHGTGGTGYTLIGNVKSIKVQDGVDSFSETRWIERNTA